MKTSNLSYIATMAVIAVTLMGFTCVPYGNNDKFASDSLSKDTIYIDELAVQNERWTHLRLSVPTGKPGLEAACCWILGAEARTMETFIASLLNAYEKTEPYNTQRFIKINKQQNGVDLLFYTIKPKGDIVGNLQNYSIIHTKRTDGEGELYELSIVYDVVNDKVMMVDDVFVPEMAQKIKADFGEDFINMEVSDIGVWCGYAAGRERRFEYSNHAYCFCIHEKDLNEDFKRSVNFCKLSKQFTEKKEGVYGMPPSTIFDLIGHLSGWNEEEKATQKEKTSYKYWKYNNNVYIGPKVGKSNEEIDSFLNKNFHWPNELNRKKYKKYKGPAIVSYIVEKNGSVSNVQIMTYDSKLVVSPLEKELERVLNLMTPMTPACLYDIKVRAYNHFFINFNQNNSTVISIGADFSVKTSALTFRSNERKEFHSYQPLFKTRERIPILF